MKRALIKIFSLKSLLIHHWSGGRVMYGAMQLLLTYSTFWDSSSYWSACWRWKSVDRQPNCVSHIDHL